uniref:Uncharacterized protein n=1 Tax=Solanum tuberosum TaxID=4113 RepID=M1CBT1_SOLTU
MGIGYIFWDIDNGVPNPSIGIDVLDMVNDRYIGYTTFPMNYYTKDECILWNGKLSFAKIVKDELHILVLEFDYKKKMKLIDRKLVVKLPFMRELSALISDQSELWFWWKDKKKKSLNSFYDSTAKKVKYSHFNSGHNYSYAERSNYVLRRSCLVDFKGMNKTAT